MRKLASVLGVVVVSGGLVSVSLADQKADIARVEQELRATAEAAAIHDRARQRARTAVALSSLGRERERVEREWAKFGRGEEIAEPASRLREKRAIYGRQVERLVKRMTRIFLTDEIERAEREKLDGLMRELKRIRKKGYAQI